MQRLILVRHGPTNASDASAFPLDEPLSAVGRAAAARLRGALAEDLGRARVLSSPALRCRQTAEAAGLEPSLEPAIAECDFGSWAGRTLAQIHAADPDASGAWMTDPDARPHAGESLLMFYARVSAWLDAEAAGEAAATIAFTHGGVVKAAVVHALGAPVSAFWRITVGPLSTTELFRRCASWEVANLNLPTAPSE
jgi:broad specificity phosphatase PhoE